MSKSILVPNLTMAKNVDIYNASFKYTTADLDNGNVFQRGILSTVAGESQVYIPVAPATGSLTGLWMAFSPEDTIITDANGNQYKIGINNPGAFTNVAGTIFSGFKPQVGDIVTMTAAGISGTANDYAVAANGAVKLAFAAAAISGLSFKVIETTYLSVPAGTVGTQRVTAYKLECVAN